MRLFCHKERKVIVYRIEMWLFFIFFFTLIMKNLSRNLAICITSVAWFILGMIGTIPGVTNALTPVTSIDISLSLQTANLINQWVITLPTLSTYCWFRYPDEWLESNTNTIDISCSWSYKKLISNSNKTLDKLIMRYSHYPLEERLEKIKKSIDYAMKKSNLTTNIQRKIAYEMIAMRFYDYIVGLTHNQINGSVSDEVCYVFRDDNICPERTISSINRYRKIYSKNYSLSKKSHNSDSVTYKICLASDHTICTELIQYAWKFTDYYKSIMPQEDVDNLPASRQPMIASTISWKKKWKCTLYIESQICFNESNNNSLIMIINDQQGEWFHGGEYDPKEILKVIGF